MSILRADIRPDAETQREQAQEAWWVFLLLGAILCLAGFIMLVMGTPYGGGALIMAFGTAHLTAAFALKQL